MPRPLSVLAALSLVAACSPGAEDEWGLYQRSGMAPDEWDHVATIHGFTQNRDFCIEVRDLLAASRPSAEFDCRPLN